jgi:hypothetical protein
MQSPEKKLAPDTVNNAPNTTIGDNSPQAHASVQDRAGLYIAIVALFTSVLALGMVIMIPRIIEAEVDRGIAEAKSSMQQQVADAKATADAGATDGRLALDRVEKAVAKLEAKGLIKESH